MRMFRRHMCTLFAATLLIAFGIALLFLRNWIFESILAATFMLTPSSPLFDYWRIPPLQVNLDIYFFNWTNHEDIYNKTIKPKFEQVGPYTFNLRVERVNITWNPNATISFKMFEEYYFDEANSVGKMTDRITTLNTVAVGAVHNIRNENYFIKRGFSLSLPAFGADIHVTKSASELLFEGYSDPYINLGQAMSFLVDMPANVDKAGFFYGRNSSSDLHGYFNIATGEKRDMGKILRWNGQTESPHYKDRCQQLEGSIGDFFGEHRNRDSIKFFLANACRNLELDYDGDVAVEGIHGYKFSALHNMMDNGSYSPKNKCLCDGECIPAGTMNISACSYGAPVYMSLPHFYNADPVYLNDIEGLRPEKEKHEFYFALEPRLGVCIEEAVRFQLNFLLQPVEYVTAFEDVPKIYFPILWTDQKASIPHRFAQMMRIFLSLPNTIIPVVASILIVIGVSLLVLVLYRPKHVFRVVKVLTVNGSSAEETPLRDEKGIRRNSIKKIDGQLC